MLDKSKKLAIRGNDLEKINDIIEFLKSLGGKIESKLIKDDTKAYFFINDSGVIVTSHFASYFGYTTAESLEDAKNYYYEKLIEEETELVLESGYKLSRVTSDGKVYIVKELPHSLKEAGKILGLETLPVLNFTDEDRKQLEELEQKRLRDNETICNLCYSAWCRKLGLGDKYIKLDKDTCVEIVKGKYTNDWVIDILGKGKSPKGLYSFPCLSIAKRFIKEVLELYMY